MEWYTIQNVQEVDSPSIIIYQDRVERNIDTMIKQVSPIDRLIPHIKTNKMHEVVQLLLKKGINKVKTATISEAELAAKAGMKYVLIAHQLVGPKQQRLFKLIESFPNTQFSTIVDDKSIVNQLSSLATKHQVTLHLYLDVNSGMNRSGFPIEGDILSFYKSLSRTPQIICKGLHVYDGQFRSADAKERQSAIQDSFTQVQQLIKNIESSGLITPDIIAGGSPSFSTHSQFINRLVSPGTVILWDAGYAEKYPEQEYIFAALIITRIISKPATGIITLDLGHKAIAAENPIHNRVRFLNLTDYTLLSQSEEHGVIQTSEWDRLNVGDVLYGVPYHVCPTVNLYDEAYIIEENHFSKMWAIEGRKRRILI